jgi:hypothetical protein
MAYVKQCDQCNRPLGGSDVPFFQVHGSISEQIEDGDNIEYRYITPTPRFKGAWCDLDCFKEWLDELKKQLPFVKREVIHRY